MIYYLDGLREPTWARWDVNQGSAILEDECNRFTVSTHVRARLVDPRTVDQEPVLEVGPPPRRRLRGKTPVDDDGLRLRAMSTKEAKKVRRKLKDEIIDSLTS